MGGAVNDHQRLLNEVSDLQRRLSNAVRHGTVHKIKDGYIRIKLGEGENGKPFLSPWLPQGDTHSGNVREEQPFKVGQNVTLLCPGGDPAQATVWPYSPNKENKRPDHANDKDHAYQFGDLKLKRNGDEYHIQHKDIHVRIHKSKGITGRVGKNRFAASTNGAKLKVGTEHWVVVTPTFPHLRISEPFTIAPDPMADDDDEIQDRQQEGGGEDN